jgi:hypothetical protein
MKNESAVFRVVKPGPGVEIKAYKYFGGEIGAEMDSISYINALVEEFGSPLSTLTKAQLLAKMQAAAVNVQRKMQHATIAVAALKAPQLE